MRGTLLDKASLDNNDIDFTLLSTALTDWTFHQACDADNTLALIENNDVVVTNKVRLDKNILDQCPALKLICLTATGTNNVDLNAARANNIAVTNVTDYCTASVVQHVFALILALSRRLIEQDHAVKSGAWSATAHFCLLDYPPQELTGQTLGIIGYGTLGRSVAAMAKNFGMHVLVADSFNPDHTSTDIERTPLPSLLAKADIISLHCPLTPATTKLINPTTLSQIKPGALLINTARGGLIDEQALVDALQQGILSGAGLDVLANEPPAQTNPLLALQHPRLLITPHVAWASHQARQAVIDQVAKNIIAFCEGKNRNRVV